MLLNTASTMTSECFFVRSETRDTSSTSSALVIDEQVPSSGFRVLFGVPVTGLSNPEPGTRNSEPLLLVPEMIPQRRLGATGGLGVRLPVGAEFSVLQGTDAQTDL